MAQLASTFCLQLFSLGLDQVYVREYHETKDRAALLRAAVLPGALVLAIVLGICLAVPGLISKVLFAVESSTLSILVAVALVAVFITRFLSLIFRMQERGLAYSMSQVLSRAMFLCVVAIYIGLAVTAKLINLIVAHTLSLSAACILLAWSTRHEWLPAINARIDRSQLREMLHIGLPLIISGLAYWGLTALGRLFLRSYAGFEELGIYAVATSFAGVAIIVQNVFSTIWAPLVYKWSATGVNTTKIDQIIEMVVYVIVAIFALAGLASMLVTYLLPPEYVRVRYLLVACMAHPLFYTLSETTVVGIGIQRKSIYAMTASIAGLLTAIGANYLLVPRYGADGAAIATAISFWVFLVFRTEMAILAWRPLPRLKIYGWTFACLTGAVAFVALGSQHTLFFFTQWLILLGIASALGATLFFRHYKPSMNNNVA